MVVLVMIIIASEDACLSIYRKFSVIWDTYIVTIFMGSGWPMFSENTLMLYQQDLTLGPYFVKWQLEVD